MLEKQDNNTSPPEETESPAFRDVLEQIANTKEMRQLAGNLIPELIRLWAVSGTGAGMARSAFRKSVAGVAGSSIKNAMLDEKGLAEAPALHSLAGDFAFAQKASAQAGELAKNTLALLEKAAGQIESLDAAVKKELIGTVLRDLSTGKSAALITSCLRTVNDIHKNEPEFLARVLAPEFEKWLRNMDFGEVKEFLEASTPGLSALVQMINTTLWNYPAKMISLVVLLPSFINIALDAVARTAGSFNEKGTPDMVADVLLSVLKETDARAVARLINEQAEMIRGFHVGSALIGEPGAPQMPNDLATVLDAILKGVNGEVLWKARGALADLKSQASCSLTDVLADNPELLTGSLASESAVQNARIRALSHRLSTLEGFIPEVINAALGQSLANLDVQEGANIINSAAVLLTRLLQARPDEIRDKAKALVDALDLYGVSQLMETAGEVTGAALRPLARAIVPGLARGFFKALSAEDDEFEDAAEAARRRLADLLKQGEADNNV